MVAHKNPQEGWKTSSEAMPPGPRPKATLQTSLVTTLRRTPTMLHSARGAAITLGLLNSALSPAFLPPAAGEPSLCPSPQPQERLGGWSLALPVFSGEVALPPEVGASPGTGRRSHPGQLKRVTNVTLVLENWDYNFALFMGPDPALCPAHGGCQRSFRL